ncbi:hypothetical protein FKM82_014403 [Ascaphus truei]
MRAKEQAGTATSGKCDRHGGASSHVYQHASGLCIHSTSGGGESRVSTAHFISLCLALMDDLQLRRLRKKLRQIETLEHLQRELNPSETSKVSQKAELRCLVAELLSRDAQANRGDESAETKFRESRVPPILHPNPSVTPRPQATDSAPEAKLKVPGPHTLGHSQFRVRCLEGHNDLVTCVLIHDPFIISGSWDTSLRVWDVSSGSELKTLCGHTEGVTCLTHISDVGAVALGKRGSMAGRRGWGREGGGGSVDLWFWEKGVLLYSGVSPVTCLVPAGSSLLLPPDEVFVSSGSSDSSIKVWSLRTGLPVLSLYTFSAVSSLTHIPNTQLLVSGSDGGKVEVWDLLTRENRQSERAHEESVTALQVHSGLLFSGSEGGCLKVWRVSSSGSLSLLYSSDALMLSLCGLRSLCVMGNRVYIATQGVSVKVLDWKQGSLARLSNHTSDSGFVDALAVTPDGLLVTSGFNIDQGHGYLNSE